MHDLTKIAIGVELAIQCVSPVFGTTYKRAKVARVEGALILTSDGRRWHRKDGREAGGAAKRTRTRPYAATYTLVPLGMDEAREIERAELVDLLKKELDPKRLPAFDLDDLRSLAAIVIYRMQGKVQTTPAATDNWRIEAPGRKGRRR